MRSFNKKYLLVIIIIFGLFLIYFYYIYNQSNIREYKKQETNKPLINLDGNTNNIESTSSKVYINNKVKKMNISKTNNLLNKIFKEDDKLYLSDLLLELIDSFDEDTDVIRIVNVLLENKKTKSLIMDIFPRFLSPDEFESIFIENFSSFTKEEQESFLKMYTSIALINGQNPYENALMGSIIEDTISKNDLQNNAQVLLSMPIEEQSNSSFFEENIDSNFKNLISKKPTNATEEEIFFWIKSNLSITEDISNKEEFMLNALKTLSDKEKERVLELFPQFK